MSQETMKKKAPVVCNVVSAILVIVFVFKCSADYVQYKTTLNSAPFYIWVLVDALFLLVPAIVVFIIGLIVKKKQQ